MTVPLASDAHLGLTTDLTPSLHRCPWLPRASRRARVQAGVAVSPQGELGSRWRPLPGPVLPPEGPVLGNRCPVGSGRGPCGLSAPVERECGFLRCFRFCVRCLLCFRPRQLRVGSGRGSRRAAGHREQGPCPSSPSPSLHAGIRDQQAGWEAGGGCLCGHLGPGHRQTSVEGQARPKPTCPASSRLDSVAEAALDMGQSLGSSRTPGQGWWPACPCTVLSRAACGLPLPKAEGRTGLGPGRNGSCHCFLFFFSFGVFSAPSLTVPHPPAPPGVAAQGHLAPLDRGAWGEGSLTSWGAGQPAARGAHSPGLGLGGGRAWVGAAPDPSPSTPPPHYATPGPSPARSLRPRRGARASRMESSPVLSHDGCVPCHCLSWNRHAHGSVETPLPHPRPPCHPPGSMGLRPSVLSPCCFCCCCFFFKDWVWGLIFISLGTLFFLANTKNLVNVISVVSIQLGFHVLK